METIHDIHIFHLKRKRGEPLFLHVLKQGKPVIEQLRSGRLVGHYGEEPRVESLSLLRNELYRRVETAVRDWIADIRFTPRFILASGIFLASYFAFVLMIRVPLPFPHRIAVCLAAAVAAYILLGRRYQSSDTAVKTRIELRSIIDGIHFTESDFIKQVETYMALFDDLEAADMLKVYVEKPFQIELGWVDEAEALLAALKPLTEGRNVRAVEKRLSEMGDDIRAAAGGSFMSAMKKSDLPLVFLSKRLRDKQKV